MICKRLKTYYLSKLRNMGNISKNGWRQSLAFSLPSRNKTLVIVVKNYTKTDIKVFYSSPILLDFLTLFHNLCLVICQYSQGCISEGDILKVMARYLSNNQLSNFFQKCLCTSFEITFVNLC